MKDPQPPDRARPRLPRLSSGHLFDLLLASATAGTIAVTAVAIFHLHSSDTAGAARYSSAAAVQTVRPAPTPAAAQLPPTPDPTPNATPAQQGGLGQPASPSLAAQQAHLPARPHPRATPATPGPVVPASSARHG